MEAAPGVEPGIEDLQSSAFPLGYAAILNCSAFLEVILDRRFFASIQINAFSSFFYLPSAVIKVSVSAPKYTSKNHSIFSKFSASAKYLTKIIN